MADSASEEAILKEINPDELVELGKSLVRIPSFIGEETALARWLASYFSSRGYDVQLQEVDKGWFQTVATLKVTGGGRSIMFNGHLDINPWPPVGPGIHSTPGWRTASSMARGSAT